MRAVIQDLRHGLRLLWRAPGFAGLAIGALAIGIGATTAVFSVVDAVMIKRLPYSDPERLALVWEHNLPRDRMTNPVSPANFLHWRELNHTFTELAAVTPSFDFTLTGAGDPVEIPGVLVSGQFFDVLGVRASAGRMLTATDDRPGNRVVVISDRLWLRRFNRDPSVLERPVALAGEPYTVIGVAPAEFSYLDKTVDLWAPLGLTAASRTPHGRSLSVIGRLKPGVTLVQARDDLAAAQRELTRMFPAFNTGWTTNVVPVREQLTGSIRPALEVLLAAVALVLLTACANVANLLLARATSRGRELAVRAALGADRARIARQLLAESAVLGLAGGAAGLLLASWALHVLHTVVAERLPVARLETAVVDYRVLAFTLAASLLSALLFGVLPAVSGARDLTTALKDGGRTGSGARGGRARSAFVVIEIVLALVLLVGAGLLLRSFTRLASVDPGFTPDHTLTMRLSLPSARYSDAQMMQFYSRLFARIDTLPGVQAAGAVSFLPMTGLASATRVQIVGQPAPAAGQEPVADVRVVNHAYFKAMGVPLIAGRLFNDDNPSDAHGRIVVNSTLARQYWPGEDPIGKRLRVNWGDTVDDEVIGVVGDMKHAGLEAPARATTFWPYPRTVYNTMTLVVRGAGDQRALSSAIVPLIREQDAQLAVTDVRSMDEVIAVSVAERRLLMLLVSIFACAALALVAVGVYGVIACSVTQRTQEIGIRLALGAQRSQVLGMVVGRAMALAAGGVAAGVLVAAGIARLLANFLFDISPWDPATFASVSIVVLLVSFAASWIPGLRATRVDPVVAMNR